MANSGPISINENIKKDIIDYAKRFKIKLNIPISIDLIPKN